MAAVSYRDPLASLPADLAPLPEDKNPDGKSLKNTARTGARDRSEWYEGYPEELDTSNNAFECVEAVLVVHSAERSRSSASPDAHCP